MRQQLQKLNDEKACTSVESLKAVVDGQTLDQVAENELLSMRAELTLALEEV